MLRRIITIIVGLVVAVALIAVVGLFAFDAYWKSTLNPIIVQDYTTFAPPSDFPEIEVTLAEGAQRSPGRLTFEIRNTQRSNDVLGTRDLWDYAVEYDIRANQILYAKKNYWQTAYFARHSEDLLTFYEFTLEDGFWGQRNGRLTAGHPGVSGGEYVFLDGDYNEIRRFGDPQTTDFHEIIPLDNGNFLYTEAIYTRFEEIPSQDCSGECWVITHAVTEVDPDGNEVWQWDSTPHYNIEDAPRNIVVRNVDNVFDLTHMNGFDLDNNGDLIISNRNFNEIIKVSRETGEVVWRMGGPRNPYNEFTFIDDPLNGFSQQHNPQIMDNGNLLLFDNGNQHEPSVSRGVEYALDEETMTATLVWSYTSEDEHFAPFLGTAERLPNGNTILSFANRRPNVLEVTPDGEINMEILMPEGFNTYRVTYYPFGVGCDPDCEPGTE